jgi:hypothetical protein
MSDRYDPGRPFRRSSPSGCRLDPFTGRSQFHSGQDFAAPAGTPIPAATPGEVVYSGFNGNLGNTVIVRNPYGYSLYAHMQDGERAQLGQRIWPGDTIGYVGSTGARTTAPHLHYSVIKNGATITRTNTGGNIGVALNDRNTIDPSTFDTAVPFLDQTARAEQTGLAASRADYMPTFKDRWSPVASTAPRVPIDQLHPSQASGGTFSDRFGNWTSRSLGSPVPATESPKRQSSMADLIMDYIRRMNERDAGPPQAPAPGEQPAATVFGPSAENTATGGLAGLLSAVGGIDPADPFRPTPPVDPSRVRRLVGRWAQ